MYSKIKAISYFLPEGKLTNNHLNTEFPEWSAHKISDKTGIHTRHIADENIFSSDLAVCAAEKLFDEQNIDRSEIEFLILCTQSPDYFLPTTACILQQRLGLSTSIGALDINLGCSGYIYGLSISKGLIEAGVCKNVLFLTSETYSKFIHPSDKSVRTIFGDASAATYIVKSDEKKPSIHSFDFGTDGKGAENLIVKNGGMRNRQIGNGIDIIDEFGNVSNEDYLYMNGSAVFLFTLKVVPKTFKKILSLSNLSIEDIDLFIFHQANKFMLIELMKKLQIPEEKFYIYLENCGNTVSSTIPIALYHALKDRKLVANSKVMLIGFGVGLSWGGCIIQI